MKQDALWQESQQNIKYAELCSALYECELHALALADVNAVGALQARLKSLPHYIKQTAEKMVWAETPLQLDVQNATWAFNQANNLPLTGQDQAEVSAWYLANMPPLALVVPTVICVRDINQIVLDTVDKVDWQHKRIRTNRCGWFDLSTLSVENEQARLLKPTKRTMVAACAGHRWRKTSKIEPQRLSLRELLLSCSINWRNFKQLK